MRASPAATAGSTAVGPAQPHALAAVPFPSTSLPPPPACDAADPTCPLTEPLYPRSFNHNLDEHGFRQVQEHQKLMVDFPEYSNVLIRMLNNCIKEPHSHLAVFVIEREGLARLDFIQNMEYKFVELLS